MEFKVIMVLNRPSAMVEHNEVMVSSSDCGLFRIEYAVGNSKEKSSGSVTTKSKY